MGEINGNNLKTIIKENVLAIINCIGDATYLAVVNYIIDYKCSFVPNLYQNVYELFIIITLYITILFWDILEPGFIRFESGFIRFEYTN